MERLTEWTGYEWIPRQERLNGKLVGYKDCMNRLAAYENIGLAPEELPTALEMCQIKIAMDNLKEYQETGLTPAQIREIDKLYQEKCKELAAAKDALEKLQEPEWKRRMLRTFLGSRGGDVK